MRPDRTQDESGIDAALTALWERYHASVLDRVAVIEAATAALGGAALTAAQGEAARREAHKLAGSLGMFGMPAGTAIAQRLEAIFRDGAQPADAAVVADLVAGLRAVVVAGADAEPR